MTVRVRPAFLPQLSCCGPIEAPATRRAQKRSWAFRNYHVAAPLKPSRARARCAALCLPQLSCCGPIEAARRTSGHERLHAFRNYHVAAPLKRGGLSLPAGGVVPLPQLSCCGPIEAAATAYASITLGCLPQLSCCGPIEAARPARSRCRRPPSATIMLRPH